jgi:hypothetical protein
MWLDPPAKAPAGLATLFWSLSSAPEGLTPGVTIKKSSPQAFLIAPASRGEATTPSSPASFASRAKATPCFSIVFLQPSSCHSSAPVLVSTVTAISLGGSLPSCIAADLTASAAFGHHFCAAARMKIEHVSAERR